MSGLPLRGDWRAAALCGAMMLALALLAAGSLLADPLAAGAGQGVLPEALLQQIRFELRLPRLVLAMTAGAVLAVAGAVLQGLVRNPLAEPALIGLSGGAALGASLAIAFGWLLPGVPVALLVPLLAFSGALVIGLLTFRFATRGGHTGIAELLLAGVAFNAICGAMVGLLAYWSPDGQLRAISFWLLGSLADVRWVELRFALPLMWGSLLVMLLGGLRLDYFALGERNALYAGVEVQATKRLLLLALAAGTGAAVAVAGVIGFVGLIVPHILRLLLGGNYRRLLPATALGGALLLLLADLFARRLLAPAEMPIGLLTSMIGGPFFLFLLYALLRGQVD